jgi:hypothetical protein
MNVEMDPTSEIEVRKHIAERGLRVVGWYHSHPTFRPDPSLVDLENQRNYQSLMRTESTRPKVKPLAADPVVPTPQREVRHEQNSVALAALQADPPAATSAEEPESNASSATSTPSKKRGRGRPRKQDQETKEPLAPSHFMDTLDSEIIEDVVEPFIGAIVGKSAGECVCKTQRAEAKGRVSPAPYDPQLPICTSAVNWFFVSSYTEEKGYPKQLVVNMLEDLEIDGSRRRKLASWGFRTESVFCLTVKRLLGGVGQKSQIRS